MTTAMKPTDKFSVALHVLAHLVETKSQPMTSEVMAAHLETNPVVVRRTLAGLRNDGIVRSTKGHGGGWSMATNPEDVSLLRIYEALSDPGELAPGPIIGQNGCQIQAVVDDALTGCWEEAAALLFHRLSEYTLADLSTELHHRLTQKSAGDAAHDHPEHEAGGEMTPPFDKEYWNQHWRGFNSQTNTQQGLGHQASKQSQNTNTRHDMPVNPYLVREITDLVPGTALDAGCGTGTEALWLASRGWHVTAADISATVLNEAKSRAEMAVPADTAKRIQWVEADLSSWKPEQKFALVTTHYAHPSISQLAFYERISEWVAPGGTLLIVGHHHHGSDHAGHPPAEASATATSICPLFNRVEWRIDIAEEQERTVVTPAGRHVVLQDVIVRATRTTAS